MAAKAAAEIRARAARAEMMKEFKAFKASMKAEQQSMHQSMQQTMKEAIKEAGKSFQASAAARVSHAGTEPAASVHPTPPVGLHQCGPTLATSAAPRCGGGKGTGHTATACCPPECKVEPVESEGRSDSDSESEPNVQEMGNRELAEAQCWYAWKTSYFLRKQNKMMDTSLGRMIDILERSDRRLESINGDTDRVTSELSSMTCPQTGRS